MCKCMADMHGLYHDLIVGYSYLIRIFHKNIWVKDSNKNMEFVLQISEDRDGQGEAHLKQAIQKGGYLRKRS